ncbi:carboxypeptidase-like regulatory domain-containing protein [Frigoriglobus tundricola]|uniref:Carboxypeptidase regulatory-like domain-containing protein n=1 Tax=Frigoriglobus tundricola TaxID=2774151 RepID=A0A6M5YND9_9BACT|nr:carboxypeptidase-like regulatory domain-containing protein [Frigoriglobus tundricola]QJW94813.1 hypothetical protein FTUN_2337 [Frigoriglobus tundricola]
MRRVWIACVCLTGVSCADRYNGRPPHPTTGTVLVNGEPAGGATVVFHHVGDWGPRSIVPQAVTGADGRFVLSTYELEDGAPAGEYRVTIEWPAYRLKKLGPDKLGGKFAKPETSDLTARVNKGKNDLPPFDLKARVVEHKKP